MIFLKSGSRTIEASDAQTHSDFFTAQKRWPRHGAVFSCAVATDRPKDDDLGRKTHNLNLINQRFESIQPDGLLS